MGASNSMKVSDLAEAFRKLEANGHGDADVFHVMGNGREKGICGWELVTSSAFDADRAVNKDGHRLRLFTDSPF